MNELSNASKLFLECKQFIKNGLVKSFYSEGSYGKEGKQYYSFKCPVCDKQTSFPDFFDAYDFDGNNKYRKCFSDFLRHLKAKIRLSGDEKHIKLLIKLFGNKEAYKILSIMAKKNILVAQRLVKIVKELKEKKYD